MPSVLIAAGLIGAIAFHWSVGVPAVDPRAIDWLLHDLDPAANFTGWHLFRRSPWHLPLGSVSTLGYPVGTSVALTDSIPLVAISLKLVNGLLPATFQYFGAWLLLCFILQGTFGALLVSTVTPRPVLQLLGASLFVLSPVLSNRFGHAALCAHWLVLAALWLNRRAAASVCPRRDLGAWVALTAVAAGTHPYLTVMVLAVAGATLVGGLDRPARVLADVAAPAAILAGTAAAVWWVCGYFMVSDGGDLQFGGFGLYSLNLLSPFIPPPGALTEGLLHLPLAHPEQHEGFAYLGLGGLVLIATAVWLVRSSVTRRPSRPTMALAAACIVLAVLALSPVITLGGRVVAEYDPAWWGPFTTFRASGRMFWPAFYAGVFAATATVVRRLPYAAAVAVLLCAVSLQAADLSGVYRRTRAGFARPVANPLESAFWDVVPRHYRHIVLHPSNMCASPPHSLDFRFFALRAGWVGATLNAGHAARYDLAGVRRYCEGLHADLAHGVVSDDTLYVLRPGLEPPLLASSTPVTCETVDGYAVCYTASSRERWPIEFGYYHRRVAPPP